MHKHIFIKSLLTCIVMLVMACQKDEQSFVYEKQNQVAIATNATAFTVTQLDTLKVSPTLTESLPSGEEFSFEWKMYLQTGTDTANILSTEKNLKVRINLPPGNYSLRYKVTSKKTGIAALSLYSVTVNGAFYQGWLVSNNKDGKARMSFIRTDDMVFAAPAETVNNTSYPGHAIAAYSGIDRNIALVLFFTDQGVYRFNANDLMQNGNTTALFPDGKQFSTLPVYGLNKLVTDQYIVSEGGLYAGLGPSFFSGEVLKPYSDRFTGDYSLFPAIISSTQTSSYFYDNKHQRFMQAAYLDRAIAPAAGSSSASFDLGNVGKTMIACDYGVRSSANDEFYFVMENNAGVRYLLSINGTTPGLNQLIGNSPDIATATKFATSSVVKHMYYASGQKIYLYDILANSSRLVYTFPADTKIADLEMLRATSKRLVVALNKGTAGEVYYFDLDNLGNFVGNTYVKKFEGFGEIVHLGYRN
ncbi:hypothetical protein D3C87_329130 [compost metagenome]